MLKTVAGATPAGAPEGSAGRDAWFASATRLVISRQGEIVVADGCALRKVSVTGVLGTLAQFGGATCAAVPNGPAPVAEIPLGPMVVDRQGRVIFASTGGLHAVMPDGRYSPIPGTELLSGTRGLAIDSADRIYAWTSGGSVGVFYRYTDGGGVERLNWEQTSLPRSLQTNGIFTDPADRVYVYGSDGRVFTFEPPQPVPGAIRVSLPSLSSSTTAVAFDPSSGEGWSSSPNGIHRGLAFSALGCCDLLAEEGPLPSTLLTGIRGLAFHPNGDMYILDDRLLRRVRPAAPRLAPSISAGGIVNAASLVGGALTYGELVSIFGSNFAYAPLDVAEPRFGMLPSALRHVRVLVNESAGRIVAVSPNQINVFLPGFRGLLLTEATVQVEVDGVRSNEVRMPWSTSAFGLFTADASGSGQGAILNQDGTLNSSANPAAPGSVVVLFGTGEGELTPGPFDDGSYAFAPPYPKPAAPVFVTIGGQPAELLYAGAAPLMPVGVLQINARIPSGVSPGDAPIVVGIGTNATTRNVTVAVR